MDILVQQALAERRADDAAAIPASLFSCDGKIAVRVVALAGETIVLTAPTAPREGSVAVLARNGLRLVGTIAAVAGRRVTLRLDDPLADWRHASFVGAPRVPADPCTARVLAHAA